MLYGIQVPFLLIGKKSWSSLSGRGMLAAYNDFKKAFDSVHRETLLLRLRGIPARIIGLITGLYWTVSTVKCGGGVSSFFAVNAGVRQSCVLAPSLFNTCMD